jgi:hypothetical protein
VLPVPSKPNGRNKQTQYAPMRKCGELPLKFPLLICLSTKWAPVCMGHRHILSLTLASNHANCHPLVTFLENQLIKQNFVENQISLELDKRSKRPL